MSQLYAVTRLAFRSGRERVPQPQLDTVFVTAASPEEARRVQRRIALQMYPRECGWIGHTVAVAPLTRKHVDHLIGYIPL